jgi:hypothetical protein
MKEIGYFSVLNNPELLFRNYDEEVFGHFCLFRPYRFFRQ